MATLQSIKLRQIKDEDLDQAIFNDLLTSMGDDNRAEREIVKSLTPGQRAIFVTTIVEGEVNNGGFNQFYYNSSGQLADMAEESFRAIGAIQFADLMKEANKVYSEIKTDLEKYNDGTIESFSKSYEDNPLNALDDKFYDLDTIEHLTQLRMKYIRNNVKQFVKD